MERAACQRDLKSSFRRLESSEKLPPLRKLESLVGQRVAIETSYLRRLRPLDSRRSDTLICALKSTPRQRLRGRTAARLHSEAPRTKLASREDPVFGLLL